MKSVRGESPLTSGERSNPRRRGALENRCNPPRRASIEKGSTLESFQLKEQPAPSRNLASSIPDPSERPVRNTFARFLVRARFSRVNPIVRGPRSEGTMGPAGASQPLSGRRIAGSHGARILITPGWLTSLIRSALYARAESRAPAINLLNEERGTKREQLFLFRLFSSFNAHSVHRRRHCRPKHISPTRARKERARLAVNCLRLIIKGAYYRETNDPRHLTRERAGPRNAARL